jgi:hypothetical protein
VYCCCVGRRWRFPPVVLCSFSFFGIRIPKRARTDPSQGRDDEPVRLYGLHTTASAAPRRPVPGHGARRHGSSGLVSTAWGLRSFNAKPSGYHSTNSTALLSASAAPLPFRETLPGPPPLPPSGRSPAEIQPPPTWIDTFCQIPPKIATRPLRPRRQRVRAGGAHRPMGIRKSRDRSMDGRRRRS